MDAWDFAGRHLYYESHPLLLPSRELNILVHNLSKLLYAPAEHCVRQETRNIPLKKHCYYLINQQVS